MIAGYIGFFSMVLVLLTIGHLYVGWRLISPRGWSRSAKALGWAGLALLGTLPFSARLARRLDLPTSLAEPLIWAGYGALGASALLVVATVAGEPLRIADAVARRFRRHRRGDRSGGSGAVDRRGFLRGGVDGAAATFAGFATLGGFGAARRPPRLREVTVALPRLHPDLDGLRVVQLSDIHVGLTITRDYVERIVEKTAAIPADLIVLTGDLVDGSVAALAPHTAPLADLQAPFGKLFVTGNHEYYAGVGPWLDELRRLGWDPLINEHRVLSRGNGRLVVGGVTDWRKGASHPGHAPDVPATFRDAPADVPRLLLAHQPRHIHEAAAAGVALQLSGHTHGGQFVPFSLLVPLQQPYTAGLHRHGDTWIYVNRGAGYWGPPLRLGVPSEVTLLRLRSGH